MRFLDLITEHRKRGLLQESGCSPQKGHTGKSLPRSDSGFPTAAETDPHTALVFPGPYTLLPKVVYSHSSYVQQAEVSCCIFGKGPNIEAVCLRGAGYGYQNPSVQNT